MKDLDGGCYVTHLDELDFQQDGSSRWAPVINAHFGARALSMIAFEFGTGRSPIIQAGDSDTVLYVKSGHGQIVVSGEILALQPERGIYVRPQESFRVDNDDHEPVVVLAGICPEPRQLRFSDGWLGPRRDGGSGPRTVDAKDCAKAATGERFYKLLVGPSVGSRQVTQFIGMIPQSKAPEHFHEYEEAICVLSGQGLMWTGKRSAPVSNGSLIFLPKRQPHCLQCTNPEGMLLMGLFYPSGSPAVKYDT